MATMNRYRIVGADRRSGERIELVIEALNADAGRRKAAERGILVESCVDLSPYASVASTSSKPGLHPAGAKGRTPSEPVRYGAATKVMLTLCFVGVAAIAAWPFVGDSVRRAWGGIVAGQQTNEARSALEHELDLWVQQKPSRAAPFSASLRGVVLISYDIKSVESVREPLLSGLECRAVVNLTHSNKMGGNPVNQVVYRIRRKDTDSKWEVDVEEPGSLSYD